MQGVICSKNTIDLRAIILRHVGRDGLSIRFFKLYDLLMKNCFVNANGLICQYRIFSFWFDRRRRVHHSRWTRAQMLAIDDIFELLPRARFVVPAGLYERR